MKYLPAAQEINDLAEKIVVRLAVCALEVQNVLVVGNHVDCKVVVKASFELAEAFLKERSVRATARTDVILKEIERVTRPRAVGKKKRPRKKGQR